MKSIYSLSATLAAVALLALTAPLPASSEMKDMSAKDHRGGQEHMMQMGDMGNMDRMEDLSGSCMEHADKIGLTDEQIAKMKPLHSEMQKQQARYKADLKISEIELRDIVEVKDFDLDKATSAAKKISDIRLDHHVAMLKSMKEVRSILTDDQFKKMEKMMPMHMAQKRPAKKVVKK